MGFDPMIGSELEFFLFDQTYDEIHNNNYKNLKESSWYIQDYMIFQTTKEEDVMRELRNSLLKSGIYVECSKGEAAPGQEEINVVFTDALNMADNHILIKNAAKEIAYKKNKAVTFMAKYKENVGILLVSFPIIFDAFSCVIRRYINKQNIFKAHKLHLYQRLNQAGLKHSAVSVLYISSSILISLSLCFGGLLMSCFTCIFIFIFGYYLDKNVALPFSIEFS